MVCRTRSSALVALVLAAGSVSSVAHAQSWASPGNGAWFNATNWTPQSVPSGSGATATLGLAGAYTVTTTNNTIGGLVITNPAAVLAVDGTNTLTIDGVNQTLNGTIRVNTGASFQGTHLNIAQPGTAFSGTGTIRLNASGSDGNTLSLTSRLYTGSGGSLTMNAGTSVAGFGIVQNLPTANNGTFNADLPGRQLRIDGATHQNNALYTAANGGNMLLIGATVNQTGGSIAPADDSSVALTNSTINGGSIVSTATGRVIHNGSSTSTISGVTIGGGMDLNGTSNTFIGAPGVALAGGATVLVNTGATFQGTHVRTDSPNTPISGSGTIRLNASGSDGATTSLTAALSDGGSGLGSFVFGSGVSVAGFGMVNHIPTTNNGVFNADVTARYLRVEGGSHANNNLYTATNGGALLLSNVVVTQAPGAQISAVGASGDLSTNSNVQLSNAAITGGGVSGNGAAHVTALGGSSVTLTGVAVNGGIDVNGTSTLYIDSPGITLNGGATILVNTGATFQATQIRTGDANTAINGNGTIRLNASGSDGATTSLTAAISEDGGDAGGSYVFAPGITVAGFGIVSNVPTTNNGVFNADQNARALRIDSSSHQNNGLYASSNGGTVWLTGTTVNQSGAARIYAGDGSGLDLTGSRVNGGTVGSPAGGTGNTAVNGVTTLDGVSVSRQMNVNGTSTLVSRANGITLTNNALVTVNTGATFQGTRIRADGAPTPIGGTGTIHLNASGSDGPATSGTADLARSGGGSFLFGSGVTVDGFGRIADCPTENNGTVNANVLNRPLRIENNVHQNNHAYRSQSGGTLVLASATVNQSGAGVITAGDASGVSLNNSTVNGGAFTADGSGRFTTGAPSTVDGVTSGAPIDINGTTTLTVGGNGLVNNGVITVNTGAAFQGTSLRSGAPVSPLTGSGQVVLHKSGSDGPATSGTADLAAGAEGNSFSFGAGQTLAGSGRNTGPVTMGGNISPGFPAGDIDFIRNEGGATISFTNSGQLLIDIASAGSFDRLVNAGTINIDGTLRVTTTQDFAAGTTFDVITGGTVAGQFDHVLTTGLASPKRFGARVDPGRMRVTVLCGAADIGGVGADENGDGHLDNNDFIVFIDRFFAQDPAVDFGRAGGFQGADGHFDNNDFIAFIDLFFAGCF